LGKNEQQIREVVLFEETFARLEKILLPAPALRRRRTRTTIADDFSPVPMPGGNFHDRRNPHLARDTEGLEAIARPTMEKVVAPRGKLTGGDPVEILLFRAVIIRPIHEGDEAHGMPAERIDELSRNFLLPVVIRDGAAEKSPAVRGAQGFERVCVEARAADPGKDRVEQMLRKDTLLGTRRVRRRRGV
jgi:hypothetical protein